jgi:hypothetical protein
LAQASAALHRALSADADDGEIQAMLAAFRHALAETRTALRTALETDS